jgi:hypothetical protein
MREAKMMENTMDEQRTCGKGLAERSVLPEKLGRLIAALAEVLEVHTKALDLADGYSKVEHAAYSRLVEEHRKIAAELAATAERMAGYWNLPMSLWRRFKARWYKTARWSVRWVPRTRHEEDLGGTR